MFKLTLHDIMSKRGLATIYLVMMCVQFVFIEGYGVSPLKVAVMSLTPLVFLLKVPYISRAFVIGIIYIGVVVFNSYLQDYVRFSTIGYLGMFVITFIVYYNLVYSGAFTLSYYIKLLRGIILAFAICLLCQQVCLLVGIRNIPFINLYNQHFLSLTKLPSLMLEPSHTARILGILYLSYLRCYEFQDGAALSFKQLFNDTHKWTTVGFLWVMTTIGSGTAFIVLGILLLYFVRKQTLMYVVPLFLGLYVVIPLLGIRQLDRAVNVVNATLTADNEIINKQDGSAAVRIMPLINTLTTLDLTSSETWLGKGTVTEKQQRHWYRNVKTSKIGNIDQYGLSSYIIALILIFSCCIRKLFSIETLLAFIVIGLTISNISYVWGCYFIFATTRYFENDINTNGYEWDG